MPYPKLTIIWRGCPQELDKPKPFRPKWFNKHACINSLIKEFNDKPNCEIICLWDGDTENDLFKKTCYHTLFYNDNPGNINSLIKCYEIAKSCDSDYIFFVEDDYLFLPDSWEILIDMMQYSPIASLYDHQDRYNPLIAPTDLTYQREFIIDGLIPYRTAESTTQTFAVHKKFFLDYYDKFIEYAKAGNGAPLDRELFRFFVRQNYRLITPILKDSLSAHLVNGCFTNKIDWEYYSNACLKN